MGKPFTRFLVGGGPLRRIYGKNSLQVITQDFCSLLAKAAFALMLLQFHLTYLPMIYTQADRIIYTAEAASARPTSNPQPDATRPAKRLTQTNPSASRRITHPKNKSRTNRMQKKKEKKNRTERTIDFSYFSHKTKKKKKGDRIIDFS